MISVKKNDFCFGFGPRWQGVWPPGTVERNRKIYDFELVYFASGRSRVLTRDAEFDCRAGAVIIVPPGITHCTIGDTRVCRWCIHFDWFNDTPAHRMSDKVFVFDSDDRKFIPEWMAEMPDGIPMPFFSPQSPPETAELLRRFFSISGDNTVSDRLLSCGILSTLLGLILAGSNTGTGSRTPGPGKNFLLAKGKIDANCTDPDFRVSDAAAAAGIGMNQLCKRFRKSLGVSVRDYLLMRRIEHASNLLRSSNMTVREIAFASGFNDPNYFARIFRMHTGSTPSAYAASPPGSAHQISQETD